jgi:hypothetical protein
MSPRAWFPRFVDSFSHRESRPTRRPRSAAARRCARLNVTQLEGRALLSSFTASTVSDLIADINAANTAGGTNTITLTAPTTSPYVLKKVDNTADGDGPTGLPVIQNGNSLTIVGNTDTVERSTAGGTAAFRLFDVAQGASLTLQNLTLQNGLALGDPGAPNAGPAYGGAILSDGTLVLSGVTIQNNTAQGGNGVDGTKDRPYGGNGGYADGGGVYSAGSITLENGTQIIGNQALGGNGGTGYGRGNPGGNGGDSAGGGVVVNGGSASFSGCTISSNQAVAGNAGHGLTQGVSGGFSAGGGVVVSRASASFSGCTISSNQAVGGNAPGGLSGYGTGGGIDIASGVTVYIDSFTVNNTINNSPNNIEGTYIIKN